METVKASFEEAGLQSRNLDVVVTTVLLLWVKMVSRGVSPQIKGWKWHTPCGTDSCWWGPLTRAYPHRTLRSGQLKVGPPGRNKSMLLQSMCLDGWYLHPPLPWVFCLLLTIQVKLLRKPWKSFCFGIMSVTITRSSYISLPSNISEGPAGYGRFNIFLARERAHWCPPMEEVGIYFLFSQVRTRVPMCHFS